MTSTERIIETVHQQSQYLYTNFHRVLYLLDFSLKIIILHYAIFVFKAITCL